MKKRRSHILRRRTARSIWTGSMRRTKRMKRSDLAKEKQVRKKRQIQQIVVQSHFQDKDEIKTRIAFTSRRMNECRE